MKYFIGGLLVLSLALNLFLWNRFSIQRDQLTSAQSGISEIDAAPSPNLEQNQTDVSDLASANARELAKLRNEVGLLRRQSSELETLRAHATEAAQLQKQLAVATQNLARAEAALGVVNLTPKQLQEAQDEKKSVLCVNNMKQIGLSARLWAGDNNGVFPPDLISMKDELGTPKVLFCPAENTVITVTEWSQLNPASISYRFMNPNGNESNPEKVLAICPIHGHVTLSDGSVHPGDGR